MLNKSIIGILAELYVSLFYLIRLYSPVKWRFKLHKFGEIDWIFAKQNMLIFVEVKFRKNIEDLQNIVHIKQAKRIINTSKIFLTKYPKYSNYYLRFDIVVVNNFKLITFENIWNDLT